MGVRIKLGNFRSQTFVWLDESSDTCRTDAQVKSFINFVHSNKNFLFMCNDAFRKDHPDESYKCTVRIIFYETDGKMRAINITPTGIVKQEYVSDEISFSEDELEKTQELNKKLGITHFT